MWIEKCFLKELMPKIFQLMFIENFSFRIKFSIKVGQNIQASVF